MINVLVFPCGSEIGLEVHNALKYDKHINLIGLSSVKSHGRLVYRNYIEGISFISDSGFIEELNDIIVRNSVDVLIPAYDDVILFLSKHRSELKCKLVTSPDYTCDICRSKRRTYELFASEPFVPHMFDIETVEQDNLPVFAKPDIGQGSQGIAKLDTIERVRTFSPDEEYVVTEFLPGEELTIDCFTNANGELVNISVRERLRIKNGISVNATIRETSNDIIEIAQTINSRLTFDGVWFFQVKKDLHGFFKLLEIAPRVAGSMCTSRVRGFNYILNSVYQKMGVEIKAIPNLLNYSEVDRALSSKFRLELDYDSVYIDFDDTITLRGEVNIMTMAFLYQCLNKGIDVYLLTRHKDQINESLLKNKIDKNIFSEILWIPENRNKSEYIYRKKAIFIDDSFRERYDVSQACGIPVFDVDCIEALIDWRL